MYISLRDREFNPLNTKPLVDAFSQFMLDEILVHVISNAANEREIEHKGSNHPALDRQRGARECIV
jgi:hypothetical protein